MRTTFTKLKRVAVVLAVLLLATMPLCALEGFVLIVNPSVSATTLTPDALKDILTGKTKYWDGGQNIVIAYIPDKTDAALKSASGMDSAEFKTFWQRLAFSGRGSEPKKASDEAGLVSLIASTKGAIGLVPASAALTGVKAVDVK